MRSVLARPSSSRRSPFSCGLSPISFGSASLIVLTPALSPWLLWLYLPCRRNWRRRLRTRRPRSRTWAEPGPGPAAAPWGRLPPLLPVALLCCPLMWSRSVSEDPPLTTRPRTKRWDDCDSNSIVPRCCHCDSSRFVGLARIQAEKERTEEKVRRKAITAAPPPAVVRLPCVLACSMPVSFVFCVAPRQDSRDFDSKSAHLNEQNFLAALRDVSENMKQVPAICSCLLVGGGR